MKSFPEPPAKAKLWLFLDESVSSGSFTKKKQRQVRFAAESCELPLKASWRAILDSASLDFRIVPKRENSFQIVILEEGNEFSKDEYNRYLVKTGPRELVRLRLDFEPSRGRLELSEISRVK